MTSKRIKYLILFLLGFSLSQVHAQTEQIQGVINKYASIKTIVSSTSQDSLVLQNLIPGDWGSGDDDWSSGDTVMVYCVNGGDISFVDGTMVNPRFSGKYTFLIINEILFGADTTVVLNNNMGAEIDPLTAGEFAQLIRVRSFHSAEVVGEVTAQPWDGATGGVVTMFVSTTLKLGANIDVSGLGFRGANETALYEGECSVVDTALYSQLNYKMDNVLAGIKGEGVTNTLFDSIRGQGRNINGGGGGNGKLSGGGGGSNASSGGRGGRESGDCGPGVSDPGGIGGMSLDPVGGLYYLNFDEILFPALNLWNRIFFGGGGGSGVNIPLRDEAAPGGNGGGLVVIVADTIDGDGSGWIRADGASVTDIVDGAGSGGGGGGGIILDVSGYKNNVRLSTVGGNGGSTNHPTDTTGPGGGGGGGIYWLSGNLEPGVSPVTEVGSQGGRWLSSTGFGATDGSKPQRKDGLEVPLRGFLFNAVPSKFWICSDQVPDIIRASEPKGGSGIYTFQWVDSSATQNQWEVIPGATGQSLSFTAPLADTTYFRRIVKESPQVLPADTSSRIAVYVHHAITNNTISAPDTVCQGDIPQAFVSVGLPGSGLGPGSYTYLWQKDEGGGYAAADGSNTGTGYQPPAGLDVSTSFARISKSGVCTDTSSAVIATVLLPITGNLIADKDTICFNTRPDLITQKTGEVIGGGNHPADMRYQWESGPAETGPWTEVAGETASSYRPGTLTSTAWYRRVALSGNGDACIDNSNEVEILNVPLITGNEILTDDQTVCSGDQPGNMLGSTPGGGLDGYYYLWESRTMGIWDDADPTNGNTAQSYTPPVMNGDTTVYRRTVSSGGVYPGVCKDISATKVINVLPSIDNNFIKTDVTVNCQFDNLAELIQDPAGGSEPGGGATENGIDPTRNYRWEQSTGEAPGVWTEVSFGPDEINYTDRPGLSLTDDYWYRRFVLSGPSPGLEGKAQVCSKPSNTIHIETHTDISNNVIDEFDSVCFNTEKTLYGAAAVGEDGFNASYSWFDVVSGFELGADELLSYAFTSLDDRQINRAVKIGVCEDTSAVMEITIMELPAGILSGNLPKACEKVVELDVDLNIDELSNYLTPWYISLSDDVNTELTDPQMLNADGPVEVSLSTDDISTQYDYTIGELIYTLSDGTVCAAPLENMSGNVPIEVFLTPNPIITVNTELTDDAVCDNEVSLTVDPDHGTGIWESNFPDDLGFLNDPQDFSVRASIDPGDPQAWLNLPYTIYFKSEAGDCAGTDTVKISFYEQPDPANAGSDDTIYLRNSTWLNADPATAGEGTWTTPGSGEFEDEHDPKSFVYNLDKGRINEFTWTIVNGVCVDKDDRSVIAQDEAQAYEGFSPNRDMVNDYFIIRGLADATTYSITIFNALGREVREINQDNIDEIDYDPAMIPGGLKDSEAVIWDGTAKDNETPVPAGTYYYVITIVIDQVDDKGNVTDTDRQEEKHYIVVRD